MIYASSNSDMEANVMLQSHAHKIVDKHGCIQLSMQAKHIGTACTLTLKDNLQKTQASQ